MTNETYKAGHLSSGRGMNDKTLNAMKQYRDSEELQNMSMADAGKALGLAVSTIGRIRRRLGLTDTGDLDFRRNALFDDPDLGRPGFYAPCPARVLAERYGFTDTTVSRYRKKMGIERYIGRSHGDERPDDDKYYKRVPSREEKENMKLCKKTRAWGRPRGIDEHLELLRLSDE